MAVPTKIGGHAPVARIPLARKLEPSDGKEVAMSEDMLTRHGQAVLIPDVSAEQERPDLVAWRRRNALRRSSAAQPIPSKRRYRRKAKHQGRDRD
ncbi:hypothetical protein [Nocardia nepalensis]|uniref:hypothetical protein n=1 Tax=Nocardia nepalensis TaxID=3375448 RepID=UPI003B672AAB